jgi:hypothetical protein
MTRTLLLTCGILSSILYAGMTVLIPMAWSGYDSASQTVSEMAAIGAPTQWIWTRVGIAYTILITVFGVAVWRSSAGRRGLRTAGALIAGYGLLGVLWPFAPMHQREVIAAGGSTITDTMHIVLATITVLLMLAAIASAREAFGLAFRRYSLATLAVLLMFGALTFIDAPRLDAGLPTPFIGIWERINIAAFLVWVIVLAVRLLRARPSLTPVTV